MILLYMEALLEVILRDLDTEEEVLRNKTAKLADQIVNMAMLSVSDRERLNGVFKIVI